MSSFRKHKDDYEDFEYNIKGDGDESENGKKNIPFIS